MKVTFEFERETKNTYRYAEADSDASTEIVIGTLYIKKRAMRELTGEPGPAQVLTVTIEVV